MLFSSGGMLVLARGSGALSSVSYMQFKFTHLLICSAVAAVLVCVRPFGPLVLTVALLYYTLRIATSDLIAPFKRPALNLKTGDEYYSQFEPKSKMAILLALVAFGLYVIGWSVGAFAEPGKRPLTTILIADIVFTVVGMGFCLYARMKSCLLYTSPSPRD